MRTNASKSKRKRYNNITKRRSVKNNIKYDNYNGTRYGDKKTLELRTGACCDNSRLYVSMARAVGLTVRFTKNPNHIWAQFKVGGSWVDINTCHPSRPYGAVYQI
ncbi:MAG: transglutaminase domain-containing protein [Methanobacteriaceae archaeon]|nr:transglutaminase domain-containing protein [Methanobacteriaceae archaeon]